jgi:hypothetical protein
MNMTSQTLRFTPSERATLDALTGLEAISCAEEGDEYAALLPIGADHFDLTDPDAAVPTARLTTEPGRELCAGDAMPEALAVGRCMLAERDRSGASET